MQCCEQHWDALRVQPEKSGRQHRWVVAHLASVTTRWVQHMSASRAQVPALRQYASSVPVSSDEATEYEAGDGDSGLA